VGARTGDDAGRREADPALCQGQTNDPPASIDLQDAYGDCMPSGIEECGPHPDLQLVDGGYAESSGIVIAAPLTKPSVEAPLGWTLSQDSRNRLKEEIDAERCPSALPGRIRLSQPAHHDARSVRAQRSVGCSPRLVAVATSLPGRL
jgi:hypothetical protein